MKLYRSLLLAVIFVFIALGFTGCASDTVTRSDFALDTVVTVTIYGTKDNSLLTEPFNVIKDYDSKLDAFSSDSEIGKINAAAGVSAVGFVLSGAGTACSGFGGFGGVGDLPLTRSFWPTNIRFASVILFRDISSAVFMPCFWAMTLSESPETTV